VSDSGNDTGSGQNLSMEHNSDINSFSNISSGVDEITVGNLVISTQCTTPVDNPIMDYHTSPGTDYCGSSDILSDIDLLIEEVGDSATSALSHTTIQVPNNTSEYSGLHK